MRRINFFSVFPHQEQKDWLIRFFKGITSFFRFLSGRQAKRRPTFIKTHFLFQLTEKL